jgi:hypothetical protein
MAQDICTGLFAEVMVEHDGRAKFYRWQNSTKVHSREYT